MLQAYNALHWRLQALLEQDAAYAAQWNSLVTASELDEKSGTIIQAEMALQQTIDSLDQASLKANTDLQKALGRITSYFKALIQNRRVVSDMRMALSAGTEDSATAQQTLAQLRSDLEKKNKQIAALANASSGGTARPAQNGNASKNRKGTAPATNESVAQLRQRNQTLERSLNALEAKYFTVGRNYLVLKKEHERTVNELTALRRSQR